MFDGGNRTFDAEIVAPVRKALKCAEVMKGRIDVVRSPLHIPHLGEVMSRGEKMEFTIRNESN